MIWCSLLYSTAPKTVRPQGSLAAGRVFAIWSDAELNNEGLILLSTKGAPSVNALPPLQEAVAKAVQSPLSICAVGTNAGVAVGSWRMRVAWYPAKKKSLFRLMGPPITPPY